MSRRAVAIIKGGLGNQLFAYAAARAFALRSGRELLVDPTSGFSRDGYGRSYRLDRFPIEAGIAPEPLRLGDPKAPRHRIARSLDRVLPPGRRGYLAERGDPRAILSFTSRRRTVHLNGYWQDEACFTDHAESIRRELAPPEPDDASDAALADEIRGNASVFVHVRRVRYSPRLRADYYQSSIDSAAGAIPGVHFEVFGDDVGWAREQLDFHGLPAGFHDDSPDEVRDLFLMSCCRHAIVANSSFSWWGAWLGHNPEQRVWTPATPGWPLRAARGWETVPNSLESDPA